MKIYKVLLCVVLCLTSASSFAERMQGYGKTSWGMTPTEVLQAEQGRAHLVNPPAKYKNSLGMVSVDKLEIGSHLFKVVYQFTDNKLSQVLVQGLEEKNSGINRNTFASLESLLTQKYGQPNFKEEGKRVTWKREGTSIELTHLDIEGVITLVTVAYMPESETNKQTENL
ncbi:hypothetical protein ACQ7NX_00690 [Enterobacter cloacae subsp. dissolvens]